MNCTVCNKKLRRDNTIGTCREHRAQSSARREYENKWKAEHNEQYREAKNRWVRNNSEYYSDYRNNSLTKKIAHALRVRIRRAVKTGSAVKNLGCTVPEFIAHLESKFKSGMNWNNYGLWHIDHIKPLSSFDLTDPDQLSKACHYSNMQPLWAKENSAKHAKLDYIPKSA